MYIVCFERVTGEQEYAHYAFERRFRKFGSYSEAEQWAAAILKVVKGYKSFTIETD